LLSIEIHYCFSAKEKKNTIRTSDYFSSRNNLPGFWPGVVVQTCNPSTWEAEAKIHKFQASLGLHSKFEVSLNYTVRTLCEKQTKRLCSFVCFGSTGALNSGLVAC
jgi:hypothetical protein